MRIARNGVILDGMALGLEDTWVEKEVCINQVLFYLVGNKEG